MVDINKPTTTVLAPTSSQPTPIQPVSVHRGAAAHWSIIVAAIGLPLLALLVVVGLVYLPNATEPSGNLPSEVGDEQNGIDDSITPTSQAQPNKPSESLRLMTVKDAEARGAICNDGSPAKYYFRPGTEVNKDKWIIYFKGGGGCGSEESCSVRAEEDEPGLLSSQTYAESIREEGILSSNPGVNADFYNWNHVKLMYCSSDSWFGSGEQVIDGETWYFHGKAIAEAVIEDLQTPTIIQTANLSAATQVIVAGSSAGGEGAAVNIDDIAIELAGADVKGFIDSSWSFDPEAYLELEKAIGYDRSVVNDYRQAIHDDTCAAALGSLQDDCSALSSLYAYLETPTFNFINQYDNLKLGNLGVAAPIDADEQAWLDTYYVPTLLASFDVVIDGLFAPKQTFHTLLTSDRYRTTKLEGISVQEAFTNWYFDRSGETRLVED